MSLVDAIGSRPGRVVRIAAGAGLIAIGLNRGTTGGRVLAGAGVLPLAAGTFDFCTLAPLVRAPVGGEAFRRARRRHGHAPSWFR